MNVALLVLLILVLVLTAVASLLLRKKKASLGQWPVKAHPVMSRPEQILYWRLLEAFPQHVVLAQVQLSRFLEIDTRERRQSWLNRIDRKSADFLICSKDLRPLAVIELDDATHARASRRKADADKDAALAAAGIPCIRFNVKAMPDVGGLQRAFGEATVGAAPSTAISADPSRQRRSTP